MVIEASPSATEPTTRGATRRSSSRRDHRRLYGAALLALWAAWLAVAAWVGPWVSTTSHLKDDAAASRVAAWETTQTGPGARLLSPLYVPFEVPTGGFSYTSSVPDAVRWRDTSGRQWWAGPVLEKDQEIVPTGTARPEDSVTAWLQQRAPQVAGVPVSSGVPLSVWVRAALALTTLGALLAGPNLRRGTRWYWLWMTFIPLGLGIVLFAVREYLLPLPLTPAKRLTGMTGASFAFLLSIVVVVLYSVVALALSPV